MNQAQVNMIEEVSLNAWPAKKQMHFDGWLLRLSGGPSKRVNSVTVWGNSSQPLAKKVGFCETIFNRERLPLIFRLPEPMIDLALSDVLEELGYQAFDPTLVMGSEMSSDCNLIQGLEIRQMSPLDWLAARAWMMGVPLTAMAYHAEILRMILPEKTLVCLFEDGEPAASGMAVLQADLLGYFSIYTRPASRRRGYARGVMSVLTQWGRKRGAGFGYLQVEGDNFAAQSMYEKMGFACVYTYSYRKNTG